MKYSAMRRFLVLIMTIQLLFQIPAAAFAEGGIQWAEETLPVQETTEPTVPPLEETEPEGTEPEETLPQATEAEETVPRETIPEETQPEAPQGEEPTVQENKPEESQSEAPKDTAVTGPGLYFGQLHGHTGQWGDNPAQAYARAEQMGLDFFALTDHSHGLDDGAWSAGKAAAADASNDGFAALYGYEISWPRQLRLGHISTFGTSGFESWKEPAYSSYETALSNYYQAMSGLPDSISQFNHPGSQYGTFSDFDYSEAGDRAVALMETVGETAWDFYIQALDKGWHLAPANNQKGRTVVFAEALTEEALCEALRSRRAYATEDPDLGILYSVDGHMLGSRLHRQDLGSTMELSVTLDDPSDSGKMLVEVICAGGRTQAEDTVEGSSGTLVFTLDAEPGYYLVRVTQADGDAAVTAPVWIEEKSGGLGIGSLTCETPVPEQGEPVCLRLEVYNREGSDFLVESLEIFADGVPAAAGKLEIIPAGETVSLPVELCIDTVGPAALRAVLTGTLKGVPLVCEAALELHFRQSRQVRDILADGSHGNKGLDRLTLFSGLAAEEQIKLTICRNPAAAEDLKAAGVFLVTAPERPFSAEFLALASDYVRYGGTLVVCGQADADPAELNRLLEGVGSTMELEAGTQKGPLYTQQINREGDWCGGITENQSFLSESGAAVLPGGGVWLVKAASAVLLACEELGQGRVLVSGSLFPADECMAVPEDLWAEPLANRTIAEALLGTLREALPLGTIAEARADASGGVFRLRGYVTAGTWKAQNGFSDTIYFQDDTGGLWAGPIEAGLRVGTAVELTGTVTDRHGNRFLEVSACRKPDVPKRLLLPRKGSWGRLLKAEVNEGTLVQVEGKCREIYSLENGRLTGCLLEDGKGNRIRLLVEAHIGAGADGENELHKFIRKGRTIRGAGLLYVDESGETVLRVRNCEEVVYVPPRNLPPDNPPTGDMAITALAMLLPASGLLLYLLRRRKNASG